MKIILSAFVFVMTIAGHAWAFNPDPAQYEFVGQKVLDKSYIFYELASARADDLKGIVAMLQVNTKNRTLRYYRNVIIDPETMTMKTVSYDLYDYNGKLLETVSLPNKNIQYNQGDLTDKMYQDLIARGIVVLPAPEPPPQIIVEVQEDWEKGTAGGNETVSTMPNLPKLPVGMPKLPMQK